MRRSQIVFLLMLTNLGSCKPTLSDRSLNENPTCPGSLIPYTTVKGDGYNMISNKFNASTLTLVNLNNGKNGACSSLKPGDEICRPPPCIAYTIRQGDTCETIAERYNNNNLDEFFGYNPGIINPECNNIDFGMTVCLSKPDGQNVFPLGSPS